MLPPRFWNNLISPLFELLESGSTQTTVPLNCQSVAHTPTWVLSQNFSFALSKSRVDQHLVFIILSSIHLLFWQWATLSGSRTCIDWNLVNKKEITNILSVTLWNIIKIARMLTSNFCIFAMANSKIRWSILLSSSGVICEENKF